MAADLAPEADPRVGEGRPRPAVGGRRGGTRVGRIPAGRTGACDRRRAGSPCATTTGTWSAATRGAAPPSTSSSRSIEAPRRSCPGPTRAAAGSPQPGSPRVQPVSRGGSWQERVVLPVAFEQYLYGLGEMPSSWPTAALRAQAVAGRTFATYVVRRSGPRAECNCDITDGANDQVYVGYAKEGGPGANRWVAAVHRTGGRSSRTRAG